MFLFIVCSTQLSSLPMERPYIVSRQTFVRYSGNSLDSIVLILDMPVRVAPINFFQICILGNSISINSSSVRRCLRDVRTGSGYPMILSLVEQYCKNWRRHIPLPDYEERDFLFAEKKPRCPSKVRSQLTPRTKSIHLKGGLFKTRGITVNRIGLSGQRKDPNHNATVSQTVQAPSASAFDKGAVTIDSQNSAQRQSEVKVVPSRIPYPSRQPAEVQVKSASRWRTALHSVISTATPHVLIRSGIPRPEKPVSAFRVREAKTRKRFLVLPLSLPGNPSVAIRAASNLATPTSEPRGVFGTAAIPDSSDAVSRPSTLISRTTLNVTAIQSVLSAAPDTVLVLHSAGQSASPTLQVSIRCRLDFGLSHICNGQGPIQILSPMDFIGMLLHARQNGRHADDEPWMLSPILAPGSRSRLYWKGRLVSGIEMEGFTSEEGVKNSSRVCIYGCKNTNGYRQWLSGTK